MIAGQIVNNQEVKKKKKAQNHYFCLWKLVCAVYNIHKELADVKHSNIRLSVNEEKKKRFCFLSISINEKHKN